MPIDAFDMAVVHRVFRDELHNAPGLVREVEAGDTARAAVVSAHLDFIVAALHHHHAAEDELLWPKLQARAPRQAADVGRMESAHVGIADADAQVRALAASWVDAADARSTEQLAVAVEELSARVDEHLDDEERNIVPLINQHITPREWHEVHSRAAEFLSRRNLKLGLVLGGYILAAASADEAPRILADLPISKRMLARLFSKRTLAAYRAKVYGVTTTSIRAD